MALERTLIARCDGHDCDAVLELNPNTTQPFIALTRADWGQETTFDVIKTYCPQHKNPKETQ